MDREDYLALVRDLLSGDPTRVREANRVLYRGLVQGGGCDDGPGTREADLVLAEVPTAKG
jgi:hypothetical protein